MQVKTLVLDWRNFVKNLSYSINSGAIACAFPTEPEEIAHRVMKHLFAIRAEYPDAMIIMANDRRPYWRHTFLQKWYSDRGIEPVIYKGNREKMTWPFATPVDKMEELYAHLLEEGARMIEAGIISEKGLEADDAFGIIAYTGEGVLGFSADSDWRQCISEGKVQVYDFTQDVLHTEKADIRIKWIAGDSGDNVKGLSKLKKNGTPATKGWGKAGAEKFLAEGNAPESAATTKEQREELERNKTVTTLPPPHWRIGEAADDLGECLRFPDTAANTEADWDRYGVTAAVRKAMLDATQRKAWVTKLRMLLNKPKEEE